jgi:hypothetical protein
MKTTLNKIRECDPCTGGWKKLLAHLGKNKADDKPLSILTVLDSNGFDDALWCLRAVEDQDRVIRLYGVWCASQVKHLMADQRSLNALDVAERFANAEATTEDLAAAWAAARDAARDAAWAAARDAAWAAASALEWDAARDAARDAQSEELRRVCAAIDAGADPYPSKVPA